MARAPMPAPQMIETPAMRRSAALAQALQDLRKPPQQIGGYGDLGARLLAQGITQWAGNKAERKVKDEQAERIAGQTEAANLALARLLGGPAESPAPMADTPAPMPMAPTAGPPTSPTAPVGEVMGSALPPVGQPMPPADVPPATPAPMAAAPVPQAAPAPQMAPQAPPQAAPNPLGVTPGEAALIQRALASGDPGQIAWAQGVISEIEGRMSAPPALRREYQAQNGVGGSYDPITNEWTPLEGGVPEVARNRTFVASEGNEYAVPAGTLMSVTPSGVVSVVSRQPDGMEMIGGQLRPQSGGTRDLNAPDRRFAELTNLRKEIDPIIDSATLLQRNIQALRAGSRAQNGAGDIAMINGLQKLIDEGVVREGDVALQLQAQGINGGIAGLRGFLTSSGRFSPDIRAQLLATGEDIYTNMNAVYRDRVLSYEPLVTETFGANAFNSVLPSRTRQAFGWGGGEAPAPAPRAPAGGSRPAAPARAPAAPRRTNGQTRRYNPNTGQLE